MCGIVGLQLKSETLCRDAGALLTGMLDAMSVRGPDSAGVAIYDNDVPAGRFRYSVRGNAGVDWATLARHVAEELQHPVEAWCRGDGAVLVGPRDHESFIKGLAVVAPDVRLVGWGNAMEVYKDVGPARDICTRHGLLEHPGYQAIGHTRMATESAVTVDHSHPFTPGPDLAVVHNGSFSNYCTLRRRLIAAGIGFDTDNDTEVAARYLAYRMDRGADLMTSLKDLCKEFDGFYTLLVTTRTQLALVRDAFACKPAVVVETADYVAVASEYHALAGLPTVGDAQVFEPEPGAIYVWTR